VTYSPQPLLTCSVCGSEREVSYWTIDMGIPPVLTCETCRIIILYATEEIRENYLAKLQRRRQHGKPESSR
jgi:hypothetical protein